MPVLDHFFASQAPENKTCMIRKALVQGGAEFYKEPFMDPPVKHKTITYISDSKKRKKIIKVLAFFRGSSSNLW